jgi:rhodanese-related sulfurtransferase
MSGPVPTASVIEAHDRPPGAVLIDVREDAEWHEGHAPGAQHLPLGRLRLEDLPPGRPVYCICRSGNRSGRAVEALTAAGVDARNVAGGMQAWVAAGLPVA